MRFIRSVLMLGIGLAVGPTLAQPVNCAAVPVAMPAPGLGEAPLAPGLGVVNSRLGAPIGVLSQAYADAVSVDDVILRMRVDRCRLIAMTTPAPSVSTPAPGTTPANGQATQWATPWRFNMDKNMTAAEFEAWMKAKGLRVAKGAPPPAPAPAAMPDAQPANAAPAPAPAQVVPTPTP